jgi:hypothetical protein
MPENIIDPITAYPGWYCPLPPSSCRQTLWYFFKIIHDFLLPWYSSSLFCLLWQLHVKRWSYDPWPFSPPDLMWIVKCRQQLNISYILFALHQEVLHAASPLPCDSTQEWPKSSCFPKHDTEMWLCCCLSLTFNGMDISSNPYLYWVGNF